MIFQLGTYNRQLACQAVGLFRCGVLAFQDHSALFAAFSSNYEVEVKARHSGHISLNFPHVTMSNSDDFLCLLANLGKPDRSQGSCSDPSGLLRNTPAA